MVKKLGSLTSSNSLSSVIAINVISVLLLIMLISSSSYDLENNKILAQNPDEGMANMLEGLGINPDFYSGGSVELQSPNNVPQNPDEGMANMLEGLGVPSDPGFYGGGTQQGMNNVPMTPKQTYEQKFNFDNAPGVENDCIYEKYEHGDLKGWTRGPSPSIPCSEWIGTFNDIPQSKPINPNDDCSKFKETRVQSAGPPPDMDTIDFVIAVIKQINPFRSTEENYKMIYNAFYHDLTIKGMDSTSASIAANEFAQGTIQTAQGIGLVCANVIAPSIATQLTNTYIFYNAYQFATTPSKIAHVFNNKGHNLDQLVLSLGSETAVMKEVIANLLKTGLPAAGRFEKVVNIAGTDVIVRGTVAYYPKISTMFVPLIK